MIRLARPSAPAILLDRGIAATEDMCQAYRAAPDEFKAGTRIFKFDRNIYAAPAVKAALLAAQHNKCAFCESFVPHISFGDVEHFRPKAGYKQKATDALRRPGYYWLAYAWENLFLVCELCNQQYKGNHFPLRNGRKRARTHTHRLGKEAPLLIDPSRLDPARHIEFRSERAFAVRGSREGETSILILGLNRSHLMEARRKRLASLKRLIDLRDLLREKLAKNPAEEGLNLLRELEAEIQASQENTGEYAAMARAFLMERGML